jgi:predicted dehydrogenase
VPTHVTSLIDFAGGATATLVTSFDVKASRYKNIEIYGSDATLSVPDPNFFEGTVAVRSIIDSDWRELATVTTPTPSGRGMGLIDMMAAIDEGRPHHASGAQALHVLELMTGALRASTEQRRVAVSTQPLP